MKNAYLILLLISLSILMHIIDKHLDPGLCQVGQVHMPDIRLDMNPVLLFTAESRF